MYVIINACHPTVSRSARNPGWGAGAALVRRGRGAVVRVDVLPDR